MRISDGSSDVCSSDQARRAARHRRGPQAGSRLMAPDDVFHITTAAGWAGAQSDGEVAPASLADEGFVHCSTGDQLTGTIERHFPGATDLVVLRLRRDLLDPELRWEESGHGTYPHL